MRRKEERMGALIIGLVIIAVALILAGWAIGHFRARAKA
jgi:hypothetical protein